MQQKYLQACQSHLHCKFLMKASMRTFKILTHLNGSLNISLQNKLEGTKYINRMVRSISTVNVNEIERHNNLKHLWWDENSSMRGLHAFNPIRTQFVRDGLANVGLETHKPSLPLQGINIADIGCGGGIFTERLARIGAQVTGVDPSAELINVAKEHLKLDSDISERVNYIQASIEEFSPNNEELYDAVVASEVLEHIENSEFFLKECVKILKPGGSIFITTPNKTLISWFSGIIIAEYILKFVPRGTHDWNKFIPPYELQHMLENYGCRMKLINGIVYNPWTHRWSWTFNTALMYALHAVKQK